MEFIEAPGETITEKSIGSVERAVTEPDYVDDDDNYNSHDVIVDKIEALAETVDDLAVSIVQIRDFCIKLNQVISIIGSNPMLGAMIPPDIYAQIQGS